MLERPDGVKIGACFIAAIIAGLAAVPAWRVPSSCAPPRSRYDARAEAFLRDCARRSIRLVANEPGARDVEEYREKIRQIVDDHDLPERRRHHLRRGDGQATTPTSRAGSRSTARSCTASTASSPSTGASVPNTLASLLLDIRDRTGVRPHIYFEWTEGNPVVHLLRFLLFGVGEVAPVTREVLRRAEPDRTRRPHIHAG